MKFKTTLLALLLTLVSSLQAQVTIQFSQINEYLFSTKEALSFTALSQNGKPMKVVFSGKISNANGVVVEFQSMPTTLLTGVNVITAFNPGLARVDFHNQDIAEIEQRTGTWPSGDYRLCIWSSCLNADCDGAGAGAGNTEQPYCSNIHVENPTPLLLSYPSDNSEITETRPNYTWIPPAPIAASASLNYTMTLVEIYEGQTKTDALALNRPLLEYSGLSNPMLMHPSDLPALEEGKSYAWQVQAFIGQTYFSKSEQWRFKVRKVEKEFLPKQAVFLREKTDPYIYVLNNDSLFIGIKSNAVNSSENADKIIIYRSPQGKVIAERQILSEISWELGYLLIKISKEDIERMIKGDFLIIEIKGIEGDSRFLKVQL